MTGDALMEKLNEELHLRIGEKYHFLQQPHFTGNQLQKSESKPSVHIPKFSYFKAPVSNIYPKKTLSLVEVYELIKSTPYTSITEQLRAIQVKDEARKFKASKFDYATFSGTFEKRNDKALISHSGLLTIDFDHIPNLQQLKKSITERCIF